MDDRSLLLEEMTWQEVARAIEDGWRTVVVAVGAVEQHGPHLPLQVDAARGDRLAKEVAVRLGHALVAPTIRVGCSEHHMSFSGTITLRRTTLEAVCLDYCVSLARHGFERVCLVPSHGGNFGPLADMVDDLARAVGPGCRVAVYTDLEGFLDVWRDAVRETAPSLVERVGGHADVAETSEMLCIRPDLVREELAEEGYRGEVGGDVLDRVFRDGLRSVTANGILGDPRGASREIGERCIERAADVIAEALGR